MGSYTDAAFLARAWHFLSRVQRLGQVTDVTHLDRHSPRHPLMCDESVGRRFESIAQDGYDPKKIRVRPGRNLLDHVSGMAGYGSTLTDYDHQFWAHLHERTPVWPARDTWLKEQLTAHGMLQVEPMDDEYAVVLGLMNPTHSMLSRGVRPMPPLALDVADFITLDGLLLLLLLYREAQEAARPEPIAHLQQVLRQAAEFFSRTHRYQGEALSTWQVLIATRMVSWNPGFRPGPGELKAAAEKLTAQHEAAPKRQGRRGPAAPATLKPATRSERRWRRRVEMLACALALTRSPGWGGREYRNTSARFDWVVAHRALIRQHYDRALDALMDEPVERASHSLPALVMPTALYATRQRPEASEMEWEVYGDQLPYDLIPVVSQD
jgi:hypothetical protein